MSTFTPPLFKNLGKGLKDLIEKKFDFNRDVKVKTTTQNGISFESTGRANKGGDINGILKTTYKRSDFGTIEAEFDTDGKAKASIEADKVSKGLVIKTATDHDFTTSIDAAYSQGYLAVNGILSSGKKTTVETSAVFGHEGLSAGLQDTFDIKQAAIIDYNVGGEYTQGNYTVTVKTSDAAENINLGFLYNVNADNTVGGAIKYGLSGKDQSRFLATAVYSTVLDRDTTLKAKLDTDGAVTGALEQRLSNPKVKYGLTSQFNWRNPSLIPDKFGLSVGFGDF